jgi:hypothetical protein
MLVEVHEEYVARASQQHRTARCRFTICYRALDCEQGDLGSELDTLAERLHGRGLRELWMHQPAIVPMRCCSALRRLVIPIEFDL